MDFGSVEEEFEDEESNKLQTGQTVRHKPKSTHIPILNGLIN